MKVKSGDTIRVHYTGKLKTDGSQFDSSEGRDPLEFTVGSGMVIHGFDNGVLGMAIGEKKMIDIPFMEGYGPRNDEHIFEIEKSNLPEDITPETGMMLQMMTQDGMPIPVEIIEIAENKIKLDANHNLAGKDLVFEVELMEIL